MTTLFLPEQQDVISRDMSTSTSLALSLLACAFATGYYVYDLFKKSKATDGRLEELEHVVHESATLLESHGDILEEYDQRIREKHDYDETEELEEGKYQAWVGSLQDTSLALTVRIWREKISTKKKNLEWTSWDHTPDGSCIVRDFYLGNSNPDFSWNVQRSSSGAPVYAVVKDTLINGWDSICKIEIILLAEEKDILQFVNKETFEGSQTCNFILKKTVQDDLVQWSRVLLDV